MTIKSTVRKWTKDLTNVQFMKYRVARQKGRVTKLENNVQRLQHLVKDSILALTDAISGYVSNKYSSYQSAVTEIYFLFISVTAD